MSQAITTDLLYITVCELDDLPEGLGRAFRVGEHSIALFRTRTGKVFAVTNQCPHRGGPLADGMLAGDQIVCPLHAFRFDSQSGACDQAGVCATTVYPVELIDGLVRVGVPSV